MKKVLKILVVLIAAFGIYKGIGWLRSGPDFTRFHSIPAKGTQIILTDTVSFLRDTSGIQTLKAMEFPDLSKKGPLLLEPDSGLPAGNLITVLGSIHAKGGSMCKLTVPGASAQVDVQTLMGDTTGTDSTTVNTGLFIGPNLELAAVSIGQDLKNFLERETLILEIKRPAALLKTLKPLKEYAAEYMNAQEIVDKLGAQVISEKRFADMGFDPETIAWVKAENQGGELLRIFMSSEIHVEKLLPLLSDAGQNFLKLELSPL
jgi:hypothetical protein